jgi:tight adherence protein B
MAAMQVTNPKYSSVLWQDPNGQRMLWYGACAMVVGMVWMRQVIRVRV